MGRLLTVGAILLVLSFVAYLSRPLEKTMRSAMYDNIYQCLEAHDSLNGDWIDDAVHNIGYIFTSADTVANKEIFNLFMKNNRLEFFDHTIYTTMRMSNNFHPEGVRCGIGIFGIVIPTVNYHDFVLHVEPLRREYNQPIIDNASMGDEEYFGENPDLGGAFQYNE